MTTCMAEITVAGKYIKYWFAIPVWVTALVVLLVLFVANLISVKVFGEAEFWFSMIKVIAIIGMILIGIGVLTIRFRTCAGPVADQPLGRRRGLPDGLQAALLSLQIVLFAYVGVELVGVTAGRGGRPAR